MRRYIEYITISKGNLPSDDKLQRSWSLLEPLEQTELLCWGRALR